MRENRGPFDSIENEISGIVRKDAGRTETLRAVCNLLKDKVPHYDWVGFYVKDGGKDELVIGPYAGVPTEHARIPFGRGVCGRAALTGETVVVPDVSKDSSYLSCSINVKSEIVVPIFKRGRMVAQIDIDSNELDAFSKHDKDFLEKICGIVAILF